MFNLATASLTGLGLEALTAAASLTGLGFEALDGNIGLGEEVSSGEAIGGLEGLLTGDDCLGGNDGGSSSVSVTSLLGDTDLTVVTLALEDSESELEVRLSLLNAFLTGLFSSEELF